MRSCLLAFTLTAAAAAGAHAQDAPLPPDHAKSPELHDGMAPGMKATELSPKVRIFSVWSSPRETMWRPALPSLPRRTT